MAQLKFSLKNLSAITHMLKCNCGIKYRFRKRLNKRGIRKDNANKNFSILDRYKMPVATGLIIYTGESILPLNRNSYYCPVGMIGLLVISKNKLTIFNPYVSFSWY